MRTTAIGYFAVHAKAAPRMDQGRLLTASRKNMLKVPCRRVRPLVESGFWGRKNVVTRPGPEGDVGSAQVRSAMS
ncbi:MAG: hypothetical protein ACI89J_002125 [Hyphomicrobiaceae bacterium]|jgi:hypothetical protein